MKEIKLSQRNKKSSYRHLVAMVDDEDYDYLMQWKWTADKQGNTFYARRREGKGSVKMHRILLGLTDPKITIDHRDRNGLNNQRDNIRICSMAQNACNKRKVSGTSSLFRGVSFHKRRLKYGAQIKKDGKNYWLGQFEKQTDAAIAYNNKAVEFFGEFASLNKV